MEKRSEESERAVENATRNRNRKILHYLEPRILTYWSLKHNENTNNVESSKPNQCDTQQKRIKRMGDTTETGKKKKIGAEKTNRRKKEKKQQNTNETNRKIMMKKNKKCETQHLIYAQCWMANRIANYRYRSNSFWDIISNGLWPFCSLSLLKYPIDLVLQNILLP